MKLCGMMEVYLTVKNSNDHLDLIKGNTEIGILTLN
jgi:hypothetical protein